MKVVLYYLLLSVALLSGCSRSELLRYQSENDVYLSYPYQGYSEPQDTVHVNFALRKKKTLTDTVRFDVCLLGKPTGADRPFQLVTDTDTTTAISGKHYRWPVKDSFNMPANTSKKNISIEIFRPEDLRNKSMVLFLKLMPNEYFQNSMRVFNYAAANVISSVTLKIFIEDIVSKPGGWDDNIAALGTFSRKKLELFAAQQNLNANRFYSAYNPYTAAQLKNFARQFQQYLHSQHTAGKTIYDEDGTMMKMGVDAQ